MARRPERRFWIGCAVRLRRSVPDKVILRQRFSCEGKARVIDSIKTEWFLNTQTIGQNLYEWSSGRVLKVRLCLICFLMGKLTFFCISWNRSLQESIFRYRNRFCAMVPSSRHRFKFVELIYSSRYAQENLYRKTPLAPKISFLVFATILFYSFRSEHQILFGLVKKTTENSKLYLTGIFLA